MTGGPRDEAVSSVVSAVLLFALFTTAMTVWTFSTLPDWIEAREAQHQDTVQDRLTLLQSTLEALAASGGAGPVSAAVPLGAEPVQVLQSAPATGTLAYEPGVRLQVSMAGASLHAHNGVASGAPDEPADGDVLADVHTLEAFVLGLSSADVGQGGGSDTAWVQATATDGTDTVTARLTHEEAGALAACADAGLHVQVTAPSGTVDSLLLCGLDEDLSAYRFDLAAHAPFAAAVRELEPGYDVTLSEGDSGGATGVGTFAAVWIDEDGLSQVVGSGQASTYSLDQEGGRLRFSPSYRSHVAQDVVYEAGAVLLDQGSDQVVLAEPGFSLAVDGGVGHLRWTLVDLTGEGGLGGRGDARAEATLTSHDELLFSVSGATLTVEGSLGAAWRSFFADQILLAGASDGAAAAGTGDTASLVLSTGGGVTEWVVHLQVVAANVAVS